MRKVCILYNEIDDEFKVFSDWDKAFKEFDEIAVENGADLDDYIFSTSNGLDRVDYCDNFTLYVEMQNVI